MQYIRLGTRSALNTKFVLRKNPQPAEEYAADELRKYLGQMLGAGPFRMHDHAATARLIINDADAALSAGIDVPALALEKESFHLETRGDAIYLQGGSGRAVLYAAYELLDLLGCRWFTPTDEKIPALANIKLRPFKRTIRPCFEFRDHLSWEASDKAWCAKNRLNGHFASVPDYMGGSVQYGLFVHTFEQLLGPEEFYSQHPEYFSMVRGERRRDQTQLCLTNPDVLQIVSDRVLARMASEPRSQIFSVSQNDWGNFCQCPACATVAEEEGSQAGPLLRFANAVAQRTAEKYPDKLIDTLAYGYSLKAPAKTTPAANVRVRLCPIDCCQGHGFGTCQHARSNQFLSTFNEWSSLNSNLYIWHYCTNFAHYLAPMPNLDELQFNLRLYRDNNVRGVFMQGAGERGGGAEAAALRAYVLARLLWDPPRDIWKESRDFLAAYYGSAHGEVLNYLKLFHARVRRHRDIHPSLYDPPNHALFGDRALMTRAEKTLATGAAKVRGEELRRVQRLQDGLAYVRLARPHGVFRREGNTYRSDATREDLKACNRLIRHCNTVGIESLHEGVGPTFAFAKLKNRLRPQRIVWLKDDRNKIAVIPGLGGRLLDWHAWGRQWLSQPWPDGPWWQTYPLQEGYQESVYFSQFQHVGWVEDYDLSQRSGRLTLRATLDRGVIMERSFQLVAGRLRITSSVRTSGNRTQALGWGSASRWLIETPRELVISQAGAATTLDWDQLPIGYENPMLREATAGSFINVQAHSAECRITFSLHAAQPYRIKCSRLVAPTRWVFDVRTDLISLAPGDRLSAVQEIAIEPL